MIPNALEQNEDFSLREFISEKIFGIKSLGLATVVYCEGDRDVFAGSPEGWTVPARQEPVYSRRCICNDPNYIHGSRNFEEKVLGHYSICLSPILRYELDLDSAISAAQTLIGKLKQEKRIQLALNLNIYEMIFSASFTITFQNLSEERTNIRSNNNPATAICLAIKDAYNRCLSEIPNPIE